MNAIQMLKDDHRRVQGLFREFEAAGERAYQKKQRIAEEAMRELEVHTRLEEEIFYPAAKAQGGELKDTVDEGLEEHHVVDVLIEELRGMSPDEEQYDPKFKVLTENVEHHIEEEEKELLPKAAKKLGDDVEALGEQMAQRREQLMQGAGSR